MDTAPDAPPDDIAALKEALASERAKALDIAAELAVAHAKASEDSALVELGRPFRFALLDMLTYPLIACRHHAPSGCSTISIELTIAGGPGLDSRWIVFIVQGKPPEPEGIVKVVAKTRREALQATNNLLKQGMVIVTVIGDGRVYTMEEFALTVIDERD